MNGLLPLDLFRFSLEQTSLRAGKVTVFCVREPLRSFPRYGPLKRKSSWSVILEARTGGGSICIWVTMDSIRRDDTAELFTAALGFSQQWRVAGMPL